MYTVHRNASPVFLQQMSSTNDHFLTCTTCPLQIVNRLTIYAHYKRTPNCLALHVLDKQSHVILQRNTNPRQIRQHSFTSHIFDKGSPVFQYMLLILCKGSSFLFVTYSLQRTSVFLCDMSFTKGPRFFYATCPLQRILGFIMWHVLYKGSSVFLRDMSFTKGPRFSYVTCPLQRVLGFPM